ncbi:MAG: hypothetical protein ACM3N9_00055 [Syntrophothermus sp.]
MAEREILLEQMLKVLKDIETNTCDKEFMPDTKMVEKKLDHIIEMHERTIILLQQLVDSNCPCEKQRSEGKKKDKKDKKEKKDKKDKKPTKP